MIFYPNTILRWWVVVATTETRQVVSFLFVNRVDKYYLVYLQDREVIKLKITRENVYSITEEGQTVIPKTSDEVTKLGEVFYKSVGPKLPILFENRGGRD